MANGMSLNHAPWNKKNTEFEEPVQSVIEIMSEQLVEQLQKDIQNVDPSIAQYGFTEEELKGCDNDSTLAMKIQAYFDLEYENSIKASIDTKADEHKIEMSFEPYQPAYDCDYDLEEELSENDDDLREIEINLRYSKKADDFPKSGSSKDSSGNIITKHNREIEERRNTDRVMQLPIDFPVGDVIDEKLSDKVYNKLRSCSKLEQKRNFRVKDKEEKAANVLSVDKVTRLIFLKWLNSNFLERINSTIATGKESIVLHALKRATDDGTEGEVDISHLAIKVYKMNLSEFKNRSEYVQNDYRFKNPRRVLRVWAEKEFANLNRMVRAGMKCPVPIRLRKNILVMSFIGRDGIAAPKLKDVEWKDEEMKIEALEQVKKAMVCMFKKCNIVHGDLSEFNILYHEGEVFIIDVSQGVDVSHPRSLFFLLRDIENIMTFFGKIETEKLPLAADLFNEITGLDMSNDKNLLVQVEQFERDNRNAQLRYDKANPADMDLRIYNSEVDLTYEDPAEPYN